MFCYVHQTFYEFKILYKNEDFQTYNLSAIFILNNFFVYLLFYVVLYLTLNF